MTATAATATVETTLSATSTFAPCNVPAPFFLTPQELVDFPGILSYLQTTTYLVLLRLSWGWHSETCNIGLEGLATHISACRNTARKAVRELKDIGLIEPGQTTDLGTTYRVRLPRELSPWKELIAQKEAEKAERAKKKAKASLPQTKSVELPKPEPKIQVVLPPSPLPVQTLDQGGAKNALNTDKDLKRELEQHTPVCVDSGPILQLKAVTAGVGFASPLESLTEGALALAYKLAPAWTVLRALITLIVFYLSKADAILNPLALVRWALKAKDFVPMSDSDIAGEFIKKLRWFVAHVHPTEKHYFKNELEELPELENWLSKNFESLTLQELWKRYHELCPETSKHYPFVGFFMITDPKKQREKKRN